MSRPTTKYTTLTRDEIIEGIQSLEMMWSEFIKVYEEKTCCKFFINKVDLIDVLVRVDKRKDYYHYFHEINNGNMSEYKEVALKCFWIIKLKPFVMLNPKAKLYGFVNEKFALYLIFSIITKEFHDAGLRFVLPSEKFIDDLIYSMKYQDVSKEAMIDIVLCIAEMSSNFNRS